MKNRQLYLIFILITLCSVSGFSQVDTVWTRSWDSGQWDQINAVTTDESNNIYVAGWSYEWGVNYDFIFAKYDAKGKLKWLKTINYSSGEQASKILFHKGHVYVAGYVNGDYSRSLGQFCVMKYTAQGDSVWEFFDPDTYGQLNAIGIDKNGNIVIAGYNETTTSGTSADYVTVKLDSNGVKLWSQTFNNKGPGESNRIYDLCIDSRNNIYVAGISDDSVNFYTDIITIKYDPNGDTLWKRQFNGRSNYYDGVSKIMVDKNFNVFVSGFVNYQTPAQTDFVLLKYDSSANLKWSKYYDFKPAPQSFDVVTDMKMDNAGNIYLAGQSSSTNSQATMKIALVKFNPEGDTVWTARWGGAGDKKVQQMVMDKESNLYLTGLFYDNNGTGYNGITLKYDKNGKLKWEVVFSDSTLEQELNSIALDGNNDVIVGGRQRSPSFFDFTLIKYKNSTSGIQLIEKGFPDLHLSCYPNPFTSKTNINYYIPISGNVTLKFIDQIGNCVTTINAGRQISGNHIFTFEGESLKSGVYYCIVESNNSSAHAKIVVMR